MKSNKKRTGRRTKLTKPTIQKLVSAIKLGCTYELACKYAGIDKSTFYLWMKAGRENKSTEHLDFFNQIQKAEAFGAMTNLELIQKAAKEDWKPAAWLLERRHSYTKNTQIKNNEEEEFELPTNTKELLKHQQKDLMKASQQALSTGSFQAYAALQRQILNVTLQIKSMSLEEDNEDDQTDEELIQTITDVILSLPPVLQQRVRQDIIRQRNKTVELDD